jgi:succinate-acetate transporter protein
MTIWLHFLKCMKETFKQGFFVDLVCGLMCFKNPYIYEKLSFYEYGRAWFFLMD